MIIKFLVVGGGFVALWAVTEYLLHRFSNENEVSRKLLHVLHGVGLATLATIVPLEVIAIVEAVFIVFTALGRYLYTRNKEFLWIQYLGKLWRVGRVSWGEYFYPLGVIFAALFAQSKWIFVAGLLQLALADAAAALVGKRYGKKSTYEVLGQKKSVVGTAAFIVVSMLVFAFVTVVSPVEFSAVGWQTLASLAIILAFVENVGVYGVDNFLIPFASVMLLNGLL